MPRPKTLDDPRFVQFRLGTADRARLDRFAALLAARTGGPPSRADALRWALAELEQLADKGLKRR